MITNPSCQGSEGVKEEQGKFQVQTNPTFEEEVADMGGGPGQAPSGGTHTEVAGYSHAYAQGTHQGHYPPHYGHYGGGGGWQGYDGYYQGGQAYYPSHYQGSPYHQEWGSQPHMVLPPGPSPTGSNNSPSPHGFSDTNDEGAGHHVINRTELKRPSPDSFLSQQSSYGPSSNLHHQSVPKKPKVSKRRKKRDPNEPQKPVSAYALFFRDTQASIKMRNPNANFGEVSKIVAATWDGLDPDSKGAYKKRTEMAKKEYLRALAAYRANMVSKGSGHELYGGFPGYGSMLLSGQAMEQAMPATGLGPSSMGHPGLTGSQGGAGSLPGGPPGHLPGGPPGQGGGGGGGALPVSIPPQYSQSSYHPSYMQQLHQHHPQQLSPGGHHPENHSPKLELKEETSSYDSYVRNHAAYASGQGYQTSGYPPQSPSESPGQQFGGGGGGVVNRSSGKCGRPGCAQYSPGHAEFCSSECVVGVECKEVFNTWSSCMVKPSPGGGPSPDVMVK